MARREESLDPRVAAAAEAEQALLDAEAKAERQVERAEERLAAAQARLERAQARVAKRESALAKARAALRDAQEARVRGPRLDLDPATAAPDGGDQGTARQGTLAPADPAPVSNRSQADGRDRKGRARG